MMTDRNEQRLNEGQLHDEDLNAVIGGTDGGFLRQNRPVVAAGALSKALFDGHHYDYAYRVLSNPGADKPEDL